MSRLVLTLLAINAAFAVLTVIHELAQRRRRARLRKEQEDEVRRSAGGQA